MTKKPVKKLLNNEEREILDYYVGKGNYSSKATGDFFNLHTNKINAIIRQDHVQVELQKHQDGLRKKFNKSEIDILDRLWEEANNYDKGANHNARITALVWIGKHLGMWQEKKVEQKETSITYNIVNYATAEKEVEHIGELEHIVEETNEVPEFVKITSYE